jgi:hypothetical protein
VKKYLRAFAGGGRDAVTVRHLLTLTRAEAARKYRLNPHRIGDVWVTAAKDVVFGSRWGCCSAGRRTGRSGP